MLVYIGIKASKGALCASGVFFFFFIKIEPSNYFFGSLDDCVLVKICYGWKDLVEGFPTSIFP